MCVKNHAITEADNAERQLHMLLNNFQTDVKSPQTPSELMKRAKQRPLTVSVTRPE
jgi:hypothetical protein